MNEDPRSSKEASPKRAGSKNERPPPPDVPPLTPDSTETNPDFIKAEMSFYTTPHTEEYRDGVYDTLKKIQTQCLNDFNTFCPSSTLDPSTGKPYLFLQHELHTAKSITGSFRQTKPRYLRNRRLADSRHHDDHSPDRRGSGEGDAPPRPNDKDDDEEHHRPDDHGDDRHHHGHHHVDKDTLFTGALGYGYTGDICMNLNYEQLTPDCQSSISELRTMRKSFWREDNFAARGAPHGHRPDCDNLWLYYWALIAVIVFCRRRYTMRTMRVVKAIRANPVLLAQVEAEMGESLGTFGKEDNKVMSVASFVLSIIFLVLATNMLVAAILCLYPELPPLLLGAGIAGINICIVSMMLLRLRTGATIMNAPCPAQPTTLSPINSIEAPLCAAISGNEYPLGGSDVKSSVPVSSFSTTTTTVTSTSVTSGSGILAAIRNALGGLTGQSSADGAYSALSTDGSVHGQGVVVTGVPVAAQREDGSNWN